MKENIEINNLDHSLCMAVLAALAEIPKNFGYTKTIAFLKGAKSSFILRNKLDENAFYGCFSTFNKELLETLIEYLYKQGLIEIQEVGRFHRPTLVISMYGLRALGGRENIILRSGVFLKKTIDLQDEELYSKLSDLRYKIALREKLPSFCICVNEAIILMANEKPQSKEDLLRIKGIGEKFIEKYADEFLDMIRN